MRRVLEIILFRLSGGAVARARVFWLRLLGMTTGRHCRPEAIRVRRPTQISMGAGNAITRGCWLWPVDEDYSGGRIRIGDHNYFNRDVMIDSCGYIEVGSHNMFGPGVYITDSNHSMPAANWITESP